MAMASSLTTAANLTYQQINIRALGAGNSIKTRLGNYITAVGPLFPDGTPDLRPVGNWLIPMKALQNTMRSLDMTLVDFNTAVDYVSKMCACAAALEDAGIVSGTVATAMVAAWNSAFGS